MYKRQLYKSAQEAFPGSQMKKSSSGYPMVLIGGQWVSFGSEASIRNTAKCLEDRAMSPEEYWGQGNGYFEGMWWQDDEKRERAFSMLLKEAGNGGLDPFDMNLPRSMVEALQALATSNKTGRPDNNLVERITTILRLHGREYEGGKLTADDIRLLMDNEAKSPHEANHWIESGWGDILNGTAIIVGGIAGNAIGNSGSNIDNPVINKPRVGSALKEDAYHRFPDIVDNYAAGSTAVSYTHLSLPMLLITKILPQIKRI